MKRPIWLVLAAIVSGCEPQPAEGDTVSRGQCTYDDAETDDAGAAKAPESLPGPSAVGRAARPA